MTSLLPPKLVAIISIAMSLATLLVPWPSAPWPVRCLGIVLIVCGVALSARHARLFSTVGTNIVTFNDPETFVRDHAFGWTRNPMYLGMVVLLTGIALGLGSAITLCGPVIFFVVANRWYIPFEERRLIATFGSEYETYRREVRRWFGRTRVAAPESPQRNVVNDERA